MTAVTNVTTRTSATGNCPNLLNFLYRHQYKLALMNSVPMNPPMIPKRMKGISSKNIQGLLYSTKNRTECSLPNGLIERSMNAAINAQKKDLQRVLSGK